MDARRNEIKREPYTPPSNYRRRRLHSPVVFDDKTDIKSKRSRISSPVLIDESPSHDGKNRRIDSDPSSKNRIYKEEPFSPHHEPVSSPGDPSFDQSHNDGVGHRRYDFKDSKPDRRCERMSNKPVPKTLKDQCNFGLSGKLATDTNSYKGVVIKYNEPEDARKPTQFWRLYPFKDGEPLKVMHIHRQSGYLIGSDARVVEIPMLHPSISKQHAVLQFRFTKGKERLYLIDLDSTNGTYLNGLKIESRRYYELREKDVLKFGYSTREYVVMTDKIASDAEGDE
ncbi:hypothetical protein Aperf_G00000128114 [Anoplocephala perfoliata]